MTEALKDLAVALAGASVPLIVIVVLLLNPEKAQIWGSMLWKLLSLVWSGAHRTYVRLDLEGRLNDFARKLGTDAPYLAGSRVKVEFTDGMDRKAFFDGDRVVLRLRRDDPDDSNFVHGAYLFVATSLLVRAKRYISEPQRLAIDLFVTTKLLNREKPTLTSHFLEEYVHPVVAKANSKEAALFEKFETIDRRAHFYPVVLQELDLLGTKVFGKRPDSRLAGEVNRFIDLLVRFSGRVIGGEDDWKLVGEFCRMGLVIVGRKAVVAQGVGAYEKYIKQELIPKGVETVYLLGPPENRSSLDAVCAAVSGTYEVLRTTTYRTTLQYDDGRQVGAKQYLVVLTRKGTSVFREATPQRALVANDKTAP